MNVRPDDAKTPLDEVMLAMDVVDTLRHRQDLVARELGGKNRQKRMIEKLRTIYKDQGIEVPERILKEGVAALEENRFDDVMVLEIEPFLRQKKPLFLYDYPAERGALAKLKPLNEQFAQRFELYMGGLELCNAFTELPILMNKEPGLKKK